MLLKANVTENIRCIRGNEFIMNAGICQSFNNSIRLYAGKKEREVSGVYYVGFRMEICAYVFHIAYAASPTRSERIRCPYCALTDCWHAGWAVGPLEVLDRCLKLFWSLVLGGLRGRRGNKTYLENLVNQTLQMGPTRRLKSP